MTAAELALVVAAVLCSIGFAALIVVLVRVLDALRALRDDVATLEAQTRPLISDLRLAADEARSSAEQARSDLERFDRVLGSAEAIGDAVSGTVARAAFSSPAIKAAGLAKGTSRAINRLRRRDASAVAGRTVVDVAELEAGSRARQSRRRGA